MQLGPVIVCGCPRSGTTAVAYGFAEKYPLMTNEFMVFKFAVDNEENKMCQLMVKRAKEKWGFDISGMFDAIRGDKTVLIDSVYRKLFCLFKNNDYPWWIDRPGQETVLIDGNGKEYSDWLWGDKYPSYTLDIGRILKMYPNAKVLFVYRDGRDVVASLWRLGWIKTLDAGFGVWNRHMMAWLSWKDSIDHLSIKQEDMLRKPVHEVERMAEYLDMDLDPERWKVFFYKHGIKKDVVIEDIDGRLGHLSYWKRYFGEKQVPEQSRMLLEKLGYIV